VVRFNVRVPDAQAAAWISDAVHEIAAEPPFPGLTLDLHGGMTRAPKPMDASQTALFEAVRDTGALLGQTIAWKPSGGVCEGNNLHAAGLPNIDTLGVLRRRHPFGPGVRLARQLRRTRAALGPDPVQDRVGRDRRPETQIPASGDDVTPMLVVRPAGPPTSTTCWSWPSSAARASPACPRIRTSCPNAWTSAATASHGKIRPSSAGTP
jgi:hypothetical protein